ncbi:MAG TPA: hypothetical protein VLJ14_02750, partial [Ktedonobacterales bacterium]|nr:hypothetical protein [Ktedonobacterales bacterium]
MSTAEHDIKTTTTLQLTVVESLTVPRGTACIGAAAMAALDCQTGDVIEIRGARATVAQVCPWSIGADDDAQPGSPRAAEEQTIAMDGLVRQNAGAALGEVVSIRRVRAQPAVSVALVPAGPANLSEVELRHVARSLKGLAVTAGDLV